jgi:hypothetical protein
MDDGGSGQANSRSKQCTGSGGRPSTPVRTRGRPALASCLFLDTQRDWVSHLRHIAASRRASSREEALRKHGWQRYHGDQPSLLPKSASFTRAHAAPRLPQALLSSAKQKPSQETVKSVHKLCRTVLLHPEHQKPALEVFVWHMREIPIPSLSPPGVYRHATREEEICLVCLQQVVTWTVKDDADHSAAELSRITLDRVWLWARYFFEVLLSDILDKPWTMPCCNVIFMSIAMLERDYLVTTQGVEVLIASWLALGKDAAFRTRCHRIMGGTPLVNGIQLALRMQDLILRVFVERDQALLPANERRNEEIRNAFTWASDQIVEVAFRSLDAVQLDDAFRRPSLGVWGDLVANIALIITLQQDYSFGRPRTELYTPANRRSVMRILVWLTGKSPADWKGENSRALINVSRTLQQCLMYVDSVLQVDASEDPYEGLVALIRDGLPAALARASPWLREEWDFMASISIREKLDKLQLDMVWDMWLLPVYEALVVQFQKQPSDMDPRIVARLRRWAPSRTLLHQYANNELMPPLWRHPGSPSSCSFSNVRAFLLMREQFVQLRPVPSPSRATIGPTQKMQRLRRCFLLQSRLPSWCVEGEWRQSSASLLGYDGTGLV